MQIAGKTLTEIANMPLWEMTQFIRKHHDKRWSVPAGQKTSYKVEVRFSGSLLVNVLALSDEHAEDLAKMEVAKGDLDDADIDIDDVTIIDHEV